MTLIYSQWMAIAVLAVVIFLFDNLREERSGPLIKQSGGACCKNSRGTLVDNHGSRALAWQLISQML